MLAAAANASNDATIWAAVIAVIVAAALALFSFLIKYWVQAPILALTHEMREYNRRLKVLEDWRIVHVERTHGSRRNDRSVDNT